MSSSVKMPGICRRKEYHQLTNLEWKELEFLYDKHHQGVGEGVGLGSLKKAFIDVVVVSDAFVSL